MNTYPETIRKLPEAGKEERQKGWGELSIAAKLRAQKEDVC